MKEQFTVTRILNTISYILMVLVNALANILPIGGMNTGQVSDSYPNLFAPAGFTFAIWGLIYVMLALFILYQWGLFKGKGGYSLEAAKRIRLCFFVSSLANIAWIFSWHYNVIPLSMVLMVVILVTLILAYRRINAEALTAKEKIFVRLPFSIYFGWITVATIANVAVLLVSLGWRGGPLSEETLTIVALAAGLVIGGAVLLKNKDIAYGLVLLWAYFGILMKHLSEDGFAGAYSQVIAAVSAFLCVILVLLIIVGVLKKKNGA